MYSVLSDLHGDARYRNNRQVDVMRDEAIREDPSRRIRAFDNLGDRLSGVPSDECDTEEERNAGKVPIPDYVFCVTTGDSIGVVADMESAALAQNRERLEQGGVRVMNLLTQAESAVNMVNEPGFRRSCYAFGVLDGGLGFAVPIRWWAQARLLGRFHPDMIYRIFSSPVEANQFALERERHRGGLAFEYLARYPGVTRVFRIERAFGASTESVIQELQEDTR